LMRGNDGLSDRPNLCASAEAFFVLRHDFVAPCTPLQKLLLTEILQVHSFLPNVKDEPRASTGEPFSSNDKARANVGRPCEIASPVSALALATGWAFVRAAMLAKDAKLASWNDNILGQGLESVATSLDDRNRDEA